VGGGGGSDCIMPADGRFTWVAICWLGGIGSALYPAARSLPAAPPPVVVVVIVEEAVDMRFG